VAALLPDILCNCCLVKNQIANNATTANAGDKVRTDLEILEF
jgi:hypothetical protein